MIFYLDYTDHEDQFYNFNISFNKKVNKNERIFFQYLLNIYSKNKKSFLEINKNNLLDLLALDNEETLVKHLTKFIKLKFHYSFTDQKENLFQGIFNILDSFFIQKEVVVFIFTKEIILSFEKNNFFKKVNLQSIFNFENSSSLKIYLKLLETKESEGNLEFEIREIKEFLNIEGAYDRFYDFEKNILEPITSDLNKYSHFQVSYKKIKSGNFKSAKIVSVNFSFINQIMKNQINETNELIYLVKDLISNFDLISKVILKNLKISNYQNVQKNILFAKDNYSDDFDNYLIRALNEDLHNQSLSERKHFIYKKFVNKAYKLQEELSKILLRLNMDSILELHLGMTHFSKKIYMLQNGEHSVLERDNLKITVTYYSNKQSRIEIDF